MSIHAKIVGRTRPAVSIQKNVYAMATTDGRSAEITMYGDIYEQQPTNWWGEPIEGQFVLLSEFLSDLEQIAGCKEITIRMNSYGGDAGASNTIHNRLRELARNGAKLTCIVDGVAMSGGSLIMCACDTVQVNPSSLIMIHKCWTFLWGGYNADELRDQADQQDAWDKMQVEIYKRKCGMPDASILDMMADTTYMTGREAAEKGFADEVLEDADPVNIAASADGRSLFVKGRQMHLAPGMFAPDNIPTVTPGASAAALTNKNQPATAGSQNGGKTMANTLEELRKENPALADQLMAEARAAAAAAPAASAPAAPTATTPASTPAAPVTTAQGTTPSTGAPDPVQVERQRIQDIDALAGLYDAETVQQAKYGENACTAQEMAYRAAQKAAKQGRNFVASLEADTSASGAQQVGAAANDGTGEQEGDLTPAQRMAKGRADAKALTKKEEK